MADEAILKIRTESASFDAFQKSFTDFTKTLQDLPKMWGDSLKTIDDMIARMTPLTNAVRRLERALGSVARFRPHGLVKAMRLVRPRGEFLSPSQQKRAYLSRLTSEGVMGALFSLVSVPVMILNFAGGIVGGIWLALLGQWRLVGLGLAASFVSTFGIGLALAPGFLFAAPGIILVQKGKHLIGGILQFVSALWSYVVMTVWCVGSFYVVFSFYPGGSLWPYLLWSYSTATAPWTYMAQRQAMDGSDPAGASALTAFGACLGALALMGVIFFTSRMLLTELVVAFCIPVGLVLALQLWFFIEALPSLERKSL
jgi:hypothetical protein